MALCQYCPFTSASSLLGELKHAAPTTLPDLFNDSPPDSFVPTVTNREPLSIPAIDWLPSNPVLDAVVTKVLNRYETSTMIPEAGSTHISAVSINVGSLSSLFLEDLPITSLTSLSHCIEAASSLLDAELAAQLSGSFNDYLSGTTNHQQTVVLTPLTTGTRALAARTLQWPLPFGTTTAMPIPASTGFVSTMYASNGSTVTALLPQFSNQSQKFSTVTVDSLRNATTTITTTNTLLTYAPGMAESPSPTVTHKVQVGAFGDFIFDPMTVDAGVGDIIEFDFLANNHTVTQSTFEEPCEASNAFDSGFQYFNPTNQTGVVNQRLIYLVTDSEPHWFFCRQQTPISHCHAGMVFSINAGEIAPEFAARATHANTEGSSQMTSSTTKALDTGVPSIGHTAITFGSSVQANISTTGNAVSNHQAVSVKRLLLIVLILGVWWPYFNLSL